MEKNTLVKFGQLKELDSFYAVKLHEGKIVQKSECLFVVFSPQLDNKWVNAVAHVTPQTDHHFEPDEIILYFESGYK